MTVAMRLKKHSWVSVVAVGMLAAALVGTAFAFTASNTVPETKGGEGSNSVTGYNVASVHYTLNTSDPTKVDAVAFTLDSPPAVGSTIRLKLDPAGAVWYSCTNTGASVTCATTSPQAAMSTTNQLTVVVAQ